MNDRSVRTLAFAGAVSVVCAIAVATASVSLAPRVAENKTVERQRKVLTMAGLIAPREEIDVAEVTRRFQLYVSIRSVDLATGQLSDAAAEAAAPRAGSRPAPPNDAGLVTLPARQTIYLVYGRFRNVLVLPVEGKGLWSTIRGFLALDMDSLDKVRGLDFYEHGETPGLGGEIDNPKWKAQWIGRRAFDEQGQPALHVARGKVGTPDQYPYGVDALSGATITGRGVTNLLKFWLGKHGYGPVLERLRRGGGV